MELQKEEDPTLVENESEDDEEEQPVLLGQHIADLIADFSGSLLFLMVNLVAFAIWILLNTLIWQVDPFPFQFLTMAVSLEAIFLSIFVLISQNRQSAKDREMARRDYESDLRSEELLRRLVNELHQRLDAVQALLEENTTLTKIRRRGKNRGNLTLVPSGEQEEGTDRKPLPENEEEPYRGPMYNA